MISYNTIDTRMPALSRRLCNRWIRAVAAQYGRKVGDIAYIFCNDDHILAVNRQYLNHDYFTDIITFDYTEGQTIGGDLFISLDTVRSNSEKLHTDYDTELRRVIIHGILHLCGWHDKAPGERAAMEREEDRALALLRQLQQSD